jgi:hypothetical protein
MDIQTETLLASAEPPCKMAPHWELTEEHPHSLSGVRLDGEKLVRFVYLDESGISINEAVTVVAGVIVDADKQWKAVEKGIDDLIVKFIGATAGPARLPKILRAALVLHASDMFHGSGPIFNRQACSLEKSHATLKELLGIPSRFHLPVVFGYVIKERVAQTGSPAQRRRALREATALEQALAFTLCATAAEQYMRTKADPTEIATLIAENNPQTWKAVRTMHDLLRGTIFTDSEVKDWSSMLKLGPDFLPLRKIVDSVHFQEKDGAYLLQIADACAVIIRYFIEGKGNIGDFIGAFTEGDPRKLSKLISPGSQGGCAVLNF